MDNPVSSILSYYWEVLFEKLSNPRNNYCKGDHSLHKHKEKNNCEKVFSQQKRTPSQIFLKDFVHFKNVYFNNTSASDQFKTKIGNYNANSFLSSLWLLKYLYVLSLNFIAKEQFISQKAYETEGLSLTRLLAFVNKVKRSFVRSNDPLKPFAPNIGMHLVTNLILLTWLLLALLFLASSLDIWLIFSNCLSTREGL